VWIATPISVFLHPIHVAVATVLKKVRQTRLEFSGRSEPRDTDRIEPELSSLVAKQGIEIGRRSNTFQHVRRQP